MEEPNLQSNPASTVGFPQNPPKPKSKMSVLIFIILGIILLIGAAVFFISRSSNQAVASPSPTSFFSVSSPTPIPSPSESASASASPTSSDKADISVEILNGTGVPGEAAFLQGQLKSMGFEDIKTANGSSQSETATTVTFARSVPESIQDELEAKLKTLYTEVKVSTSSTLSGIDIRILTGLRKGASPRPSASPTPRPTTSSSPTSSSTPTATPTASASPAN